VGLDDVSRLEAILDTLKQRGLAAKSVRVGSVSVELATDPPPDISDVQPHAIESDAERKRREQAEFEEIMYGAAQGPDFS